MPTQWVALPRGPVSSWVLVADAANGWAWQSCSSPLPPLPRWPAPRGQNCPHPHLRLGHSRWTPRRGICSWGEPWGFLLSRLGHLRSCRLTLPPSRSHDIVTIAHCNGAVPRVAKVLSPPSDGLLMSAARSSYDGPLDVIGDPHHFHTLLMCNGGFITTNQIPAAHWQLTDQSPFVPG